MPMGYGDFIRNDSEASSSGQHLFQSPPHVTLPCKAGNAETKASSVISISEKTELMLPGKQNLGFLLNSLSAYLLELSKLGWNIIKAGSCGPFIKRSQSTYFPGKDNPKRTDWGNTRLKRDSAPPRLSVYYEGGGIAISWCPQGSFSQLPKKCWTLKFLISISSGHSWTRDSLLELVSYAHEAATEQRGLGLMTRRELE